MLDEDCGDRQRAKAVKRRVVRAFLHCKEYSSTLSEGEAPLLGFAVLNTIPQNIHNYREIGVRDDGVGDVSGGGPMLHERVEAVEAVEVAVMVAGFSFSPDSMRTKSCESEEL